MARYVERRGRARHQQANFTIEQHYRVDIFCASIDSQLQELNRWFSEHAVELLFSARLLILEPHVNLLELMIFVSW
jgi:hypothetical protein